MNYRQARTVFGIALSICAIGWAVFLLFFAPDGFIGPEPPIASWTGARGLLHFFLLVAAILALIISAVGLVITSVLCAREARRRY
jgi:hypothetical protein